ncbi:MAG: hypothetical protein M1587_09370 [Thaumarchaeota archaeon]|nr:hypothetical protein [Nitrososphaerota archaeon]MCL5067738.1 hypothetical protein [Nitrososphaerota archaeon]
MKIIKPGIHSFLNRFKRKTETTYGPEQPLPCPVAAFIQSTGDGSASIGDEDGTIFFDYQPCRIASVVKVVMFGEQHNEYVVLYNDKKGKEHRLMTRLGDHIVKNKILVREFKTLFKVYEETLNKASCLAIELDVVERRLRQHPVREEEVAELITLVNSS